MSNIPTSNTGPAEHQPACDQSSDPPPYTAVAGNNDKGPSMQGEGTHGDPPPYPADALPTDHPPPPFWPTQLSQPPNLPSEPVRLIISETGVPISVPPGVQVIVVPANRGTGGRNGGNRRTASINSLDESRRIRAIALPLAVFSLFFGSLFCAIPAVICACRHHAPASDYRRSIVLSSIAIVLGISGMVLYSLRVQEQNGFLRSGNTAQF